jgi:hypothetical protein
MGSIKGSGRKQRNIIEDIISLKNAVFWDTAARRHIPEDGILHSDRCGNLKSYISFPYLPLDC